MDKFLCNGRGVNMKTASACVLFDTWDCTSDPIGTPGSSAAAMLTGDDVVPFTRSARNATTSVLPTAVEYEQHPPQDGVIHTEPAEEGVKRSAHTSSARHTNTARIATTGFTRRRA